MIVGCSLFVDRCLLFVAGFGLWFVSCWLVMVIVCCLLWCVFDCSGSSFVVCCLLRVDCWLLLVCRWLLVVCWCLPDVRCSLFVVCCMLLVDCCIVFVVCLPFVVCCSLYC